MNIGLYFILKIITENLFLVQYNRKRVAHVNLYDENSKEINDDFFDVLMAEDGITHNRRIIDAFERAKAIHKSKLANGAEYRESVTTIYELMEELGTIQYDENDRKYKLCSY